MFFARSLEWMGMVYETHTQHTHTTHTNTYRRNFFLAKSESTILSLRPAENVQQREATESLREFAPTHSRYLKQIVCKHDMTPRVGDVHGAQPIVNVLYGV